MNDPLERLRLAAKQRQDAGLRRQLRPRAATGDLIDLAGNDYLGLCGDPRVIAGSIEAVEKWGTGSTGSRLVTGTTTLHQDLEDELADFADAAAALVFSSGYLANVGAITALANRETLVVSDEANHASIVDGCRLSRARVVVTPHRDVDAVHNALSTRDEPDALVVTDSVFSVSGQLAPLAGLAEVARAHGAFLVVDEAHALGVVGERGQGAVHELGLSGDPRVVRTVTLSKSLAAQGGAVLGHPDVIAHLVDTARSFIFDTGLAPAAAGAALAALRVLKAEPERARRVRRIAGELAAIAAAHGFSSQPDLFPNRARARTDPAWLNTNTSAGSDANLTHQQSHTSTEWVGTGPNTAGDIGPGGARAATDTEWAGTSTTAKSDGGATWARTDTREVRTNTSAGSDRDVGAEARTDTAWVGTSTSATIDRRTGAWARTGTDGVRTSSARKSDDTGYGWPSAVVPVIMGDAERAVRAAAICAEHGLRVGCFRPPSVQQGRSCLRLTARADLTEAELSKVDASFAVIALRVSP
jgi:8-amino-7-oxononanoate synthase